MKKKANEVPYFAIGNNELAEKDDWDGGPVICPRCKEKHEVEFGKGKDGTEVKSLGFVNCPASPENKYMTFNKQQFLEEKKKELEVKWQQHFRGTDIQYADEIFVEFFEQSLNEAIQKAAGKLKDILDDFDSVDKYHKNDGSGRMIKDLNENINELLK